MRLRKIKNIKGKSPFISSKTRKLSFKEYFTYLRVIIQFFIFRKIDTSIKLGMIPGFVSKDGVARPLILNRRVFNKIVNDHGSFYLKNLMSHSRDWEYIICNVNKNLSKINLIVRIKDNHHFATIGANRHNGYYVVTYYETYTSKENKLKNLLYKKGDTLDRAGRAVGPSFATASEGSGKPAGPFWRQNG